MSTSFRSVESLPVLVNVILTSFAGRFNHLVSLLPSNALHLISPTTSLAVSSFLERAGLPEPIIGLTACILESLSNRFLRSWRQATFYAHVQSARAESIVLAALCIASGFLDDRQRTTTWWSEEVAESSIRTRELNVTVRCILLDIDYDVHSFTAEMIADALAEMTQAGKGQQTAAKVEIHVTGMAIPSINNALEEGGERYNGGGALWQNGLVTPEPSPPCIVNVPFLVLL